MVAAKDECLGNDNIKNVSLTNFPNYFLQTFAFSDTIAGKSE